MFTRNKAVKPDEQADPRTGEIPNYQPPAEKRALLKPDLTRATSVNDVAGKNPDVVNLRDHPELDGKTIAIMDYKESSGEYGPFVILDVWTIENDQPKDHLIVMTGSENVVARVLMCQETINQKIPVLGKFRTSGDAWFLD